MDILIYTAPLTGEGDPSHGLLRRAAAQYMGAPCDLALAFGARGKPYFPAAPQLCFSISHTRGWWACAFSRCAVGLDIQFHQSTDRSKLSRRFFHPAEDAFLRCRGYAPFFDVWSAKESYLKYTGQGITEDLRSFSVVSGDVLPAPVGGTQLRLLSWREDCSACICAKTLGNITWIDL